VKLPSKLFSYRESIISKFPIILNAFKQDEYLTICELYLNVSLKFIDITEFVETLESLYILGKIKYSYELRRVYRAV
jgi:hypothetical protein